MKILLVVVFAIVRIFPQDSYRYEEAGYPVSIQKANNGFIYTDNHASRIYSVINGKVEVILSQPNVGRYYSYNSLTNEIGYKKFMNDGLQIPAIYNIDNKEEILLYDPVEKAGQVSFSKNNSSSGITHNHNKFAFSVDKEIVVVENGKVRKYEIGVYSNLTPLSPDGNYVAYNDLADNIWILDIHSNEKIQITTDNGYYNPIWSADGNYLLITKLDNSIFTYSLAEGSLFLIGEGLYPSWSDAKNELIYVKIHFNQYIIDKSEVVVSSYNGKESKTIYSSDSYISSPVIAKGTLIFYEERDKSFLIAKADNVFENIEVTDKIKADIDIEHHNQFYNHNIEEIQALDMPYVHQVYDTPDWHNGHWSCGPTAAITTLAYFNAIPKWDGWCSWPSPGHYNSYGRYVAERYRFRENNYDLSANDAGSNPAWGGYGFMWNGGSPNSKMATYYSRHNVAAQHKSSPSYEEILGEINGGFPYTMCVMLTTSGHLIVAHGLKVERTFTYNDPYGNKNTPGYPSYDGKNVYYDWPGYNNGYQNLVGVPWGIKTRYSILAEADTLVDDLHFDKGFYLHNKGAASMYRWRDKNSGYNGHFWFTSTNSSIYTDTCYVIWKPKINVEGKYEIFAYIPFSNATRAIYKVYHKNGMDTVVINQKNVSNDWVSLGIFDFRSNNTNYVRLGDASFEAGQEIVFDAMSFQFRGTTEVQTNESTINQYYLSENYPNPFNPTTMIKYQIPKETFVSLRVFDLLGKEVALLINEVKSPGDYELHFNSNSYNLTNGTYFYRLEAGDYINVKKMLLLK